MVSFGNREWKYKNYEEILIKLVNKKQIGGECFENSLQKLATNDGYFKREKENEYSYTLGLS